jgi:hypothetical protein
MPSDNKKALPTQSSTKRCSRTSKTQSDIRSFFVSADFELADSNGEQMKDSRKVTIDEQSEVGDELSGGRKIRTRKIRTQ